LFFPSTSIPQASVAARIYFCLAFSAAFQLGWAISLWIRALQQVLHEGRKLVVRGDLIIKIYRRLVKKRYIKAITRVHECEELVMILKDYPNLNFQAERSPELILKTLKWMFIGEDINYWNYSGRNRLKSHLDSNFYRTSAIT